MREHAERGLRHARTGSWQPERGYLNTLKRLGGGSTLNKGPRATWPPGCARVQACSIMLDYAAPYPRNRLKFDSEGVISEERWDVVMVTDN